jgi:hypothetical protein
MEMALCTGNHEAAQWPPMVATECVIAVETKDHLHWELISVVAEACSAQTTTVSIG